MFKKILVLNLLSLSCLADSELYGNSEDISNVLGNNPYEPNYFSMFFGLFFVIALVYLTAFLYQKLVKIKLNSQEETEVLRPQIISSLSLGQNKNLFVIKIGETYSLVGATQNNISHIKDFTQEEIQRGKNG